MTAAFEPEIVFPDDPFEAAIIYLAVMAYPEQGAGQIGRPGSEFADALVKFTLWAARQGRGLRWMRDERRDPGFTAPRQRDFRGPFQRGMRRIDRRIAAYDVLGTRLLQGFFGVWERGTAAIREGRAEQAYHLHPEGGPSPARAELWDAAMPTSRRTIARAEPHWSARFGLNQTGPAADRASKSRDVYRRGFLPSVPVLHLVHGFTTCADKHGPSIRNWEHRDPITAMLLNFPLWIWEALDIAEQWQAVSGIAGMLDVEPDDMIRIVRSDGNRTEGENAPSASAPSGASSVQRPSG
ncbi:MAG: hypothetical protein V4472_12795 [Pseudomonadota bacterium]